MNLLEAIGLPLAPLTRAAVGAATALGAGLVVTPLLAGIARRRKLTDREGKSESEQLEALHAAKRSTPIVGGLGLLAGTALSAFVVADLTSAAVLALLGTFLALGALGMADDWEKTFGKTKTKGLTARQKLAGQVTFGAALGVFLVARAMWGDPAGGPSLEQLTTIGVPFTGWSLSIGALGLVAFTTLVTTATSNAVNLTDGLDGLAGGCGLVATSAYAALGFAAGDAELAARLGLPHVAGATEVGVVLFGVVGALTAFLVFNRHPARVFMGDAGSLPLGGALGAAAVLVKQELLLVLIGGVFVAEAVSVLAQVASFKLTGKRVLRCAPLHHHYEFGGWKETKVVARFHAAAIALTLAALTGLGAGR